MAKTPSPTEETQADQAEPARLKDNDFPIVGIGMSAGGLEVASSFLRAMPADSGMAFVIVQHLDPTRESLLADLLSRETKMPLAQVKEGMRVKPDHVYVIVPAKTLLIEDGVFRLENPEEKRGLRHPIDKFFASLANDKKEKAIAIVLTGAGSNGSAGLLDIKQMGGLCIAQDPKTAKFDSMPRHAIATDLIDYVLAPEDMPKALIEYAQHSYIADKPEVIEAKSANGIDDVLEMLRASGIHDFSAYKRTTLARRVHRRMGLAHIENLDEYIALLKEDRPELTALGKDLMINVTAFFRDPEAWDALGHDVIAPLIERAASDQTIRAWVTACSTGEEAYSVAMLLSEYAESSGKALNIKVFATDAAEHHLGAARKATFPGSMVEALSPKRLERFFDKIEDNYYRVKPHIRERVLFAPQNLLNDPPYSRMDLVCCRNLLIYLQPQAQEKVLSLAHFALREGGYLFLGNAETIGARGHLFENISKRWRIYRRLGAARSSAIHFSDWPNSENAPQRDKIPPKLADIALKTLADHFAPASVLIDRNYCALHFHGNTEEFLLQPAGSPTMDVLALAREGLRLPIRSAVQKVIEERKPATIQASMKVGGQKSIVNVSASPVRYKDDDHGMIMLTFARNQEIVAQPDEAIILPAGSINTDDIERQLREAREEMHNTVEQYETTNEELTAANEEVTSVNEELQATNEELEASKEELQALNEELSTINAQLDRKIVELGTVSDDLKNLLLGNDIATIFLDMEMQIKWFTPALSSVFSLRLEDIGRPIADFAQGFTGGDLLEKAREAVEHLKISEAEVGSDSGRCYRMRVLPYRTHDNRIAGAVATFVDITDLKQVFADTKAEKNFSVAVVESVRTPLLVLDDDLRVQMVSAAFSQMFKIEADKAVGVLVYDLDKGMWNGAELRLLLEDMLPQHGQIDDFEMQITTESRGTRDLSLHARRVEADSNRRAAILLSIEDVTERKASERHQELMIGELSHRVKNTLTVVQSIASQTKRGSHTLDAFSESFSGRLQALASANDLVIAGNWKVVDLRHLVNRAIRPFSESEQFVISDGPPIHLRPQPSLALAMIFHELATNAVKYGSLSTRSGSIFLTWEIDSKTDASDQILCFHWQESGGPAVVVPDRQGQGSRFIERSIAYDLQGKVDLDYASDGLKVLICVPLTDAIIDSTLGYEKEQIQ